MDGWQERFAAAVSATAVGHVAVGVGRPVGAGWVALPDAAAAAQAWHVELTDRVGDRLAAASYLAGWIAEVPALLVAVPVIFGGPIPTVSAGDLHVARHAGGWFDRLAIAPGAVTDPVDPLPAVAAVLHELSAPLVATLADRLPVGAPAIWGSVADSLATRALDVARATGRDPERAWTDAMVVLDEVERRTATRVIRPQPLLVPWAGGTARCCTRGTCCRYHRTVEAPDPHGEGYCLTCPLRATESTVERLGAYLTASA